MSSPQMDLAGFGLGKYQESQRGDKSYSVLKYWRMRKFDLNNDTVISKAELIQAGCRVDGRFTIADKNLDGVLNKREARRASDYLFKALYLYQLYRMVPNAPLWSPNSFKKTI